MGRSKIFFAGGPPVKPVGIFVATRWELQAVRRALAADYVRTFAGVGGYISRRGSLTYWLIQTGIGPERARLVAAQVLQAQPMSLVISTGFACALVPAQVGDLIVGTAVSSVDYQESWTIQGDGIVCDTAVHAEFLGVAQGAGLTARVGPVVSAPTVVWQAEDKRYLHRLSDATGLDMESAALASVAHQHEVSMGIVRTVSDLVDEDLPLDLNLFFRRNEWLTGLQMLIKSPASISGLNRLRKQSRVAADRLTQWFQYYVEADIDRSHLR